MLFLSFVFHPFRMIYNSIPMQNILCTVWSDGEWDYWNKHFRVWWEVKLSVLKLVHCRTICTIASNFQLCAGSLILEMGALTLLTGDPRYESVALRALRKLWSMQSSLKLFGTTLDVSTGKWIEHSAGIGAGS